MSSRIVRLNERVTALERSLKEIKDQLGLLPKRVNPFEWDSFDDIDKQILRLLLAESEFNLLSAPKIAECLKLDRVKVWRHLKRIQRISKSLKGFPMLVYEPSEKKWGKNVIDYEFEIPEEKVKE